jgi:conjugal transfer ATP-binding protein TraC
LNNLQTNSKKFLKNILGGTAMSYEIPQSLQYKEKIIFGLTLEQLFYAAGFGALSVVTYTTINTTLPIKIASSLIPAAIGSLFIFADLKNKLVKWTGWLKSRTITREQLSKFLGLEKIAEDCYIINSKGSKRRVAVIEVEPTNFSVKNEESKSSILYSFQKLLNAIDFPIQILMFTDKASLQRYITDLEKRCDGNEYKELLEGHKHYVLNQMSSELSGNRRFLIAIKETSMGLESQVKIIRDFLGAMSLRSHRLKGYHLVRIITKFFDRKKAKTLSETMFPKKIVNSPDHLQIDNHYRKFIAATGYPRNVEEGFLDKIVTARGHFDLSIHIEPQSIESTMVMLSKLVQKQRADLYAAQLKNIFSPSLETQFQDTKNVLKTIQKGEEKLFNISLYISIKAETLEELHMQTKSIESILNSIMVIPKSPKFLMTDALKSMLPFGNNTLGITRNITTRALSACFPFTSPFLMQEEGGIFLGLNKNNLPIIKDVFKLSNPNGAILATSGGGKSYTAKLIVSRYLLTGTKVIIIDPQSEYKRLAETLGGSVIKISMKSDTIINPLDLLSHSYVEKRLALIDMFRTMFGAITEIQQAVLDNALTETYAKKGITAEHYRGKVAPKLGDLYDNLKRLSKGASVYERGPYAALLGRLKMYTTGVFKFLNRETQIDVTNKFVVFDVGAMPKQIKPLMMFLILDYVYSQMKHDSARKILLIDEAWSLLQNASEEGYIFEIVKTCRKYNLGLLMITQDVGDLVGSKAGRALLSNSSYTVLLRQKPAVINNVVNAFHLSKTEKQHLLTAQVGEGLLLLENDHQQIKIRASPKEHDVITTNPADLEKIEKQEEKEKEEFDLNLDLDRGVFLKRELRPEQIDYLLNHDYVESKHVPLDSTTHSTYLVKKIGNATIEHTFLTYVIYHEILKYTKEVIVDWESRKESVNPDIVFTNSKREKVAIEVETGTNLKHHKVYLDKKRRRLNEEFESSWIIVLTHSDWKTRYETLFEVPVLLRQDMTRWVKDQF